jgi:hypothetical protein
MKFTIAAGILTQMLPAAISEKSPSKLLEQDVSKTNKNDFAASQTLKSFLARKGRETIGHQRPQLLGGLLKNDYFAPTMKACDPASNDPDIGILSCDAGYECVFDQPSTLGGLCTSMISRDLQEEEKCRLCGDGMVVGLGKIVIALEDPDYEGGICLDYEFQAYTNGLQSYDVYYMGFNATACVSASIVVQQAGCCVPSYDCNLCGEGELMPDVIFSSTLITAKCGWLAEKYNDDICTYNAPYIAPTCCNFTTVASSVVPTPAPVASPSVPDTPSPPSTSSASASPSVPGTDTPSPPPTTSSASEGRWSTSALVSMMSLTVVTAAGSLLLN